MKFEEQKVRNIGRAYFQALKKTYLGLLMDGMIKSENKALDIL